MSQLGLLFPIYGKIKTIFQTTSQLWFLHPKFSASWALRRIAQRVAGSMLRNRMGMDRASWPSIAWKYLGTVIWRFIRCNWLFLWDDIHSINVVCLVLITGISGHNCSKWGYTMHITIQKNVVICNYTTIKFHKLVDNIVI